MIGQIWTYIVALSFGKITLFFFGYLILTSLLITVFSDRGKDKSFVSLVILNSFVTLAYFIELIKLAIRGLPSAIRFLTTSIVPQIRVPLLVLAIVLAGLGLFAFRVYQRNFYGLAEVSFAIASIWVAVTKAYTSPTDGGAWTAIAGAAYLLVRGLDNATFGMDQKQLIVSVKGVIEKWALPKHILNDLDVGDTKLDT